MPSSECSITDALRQLLLIEHTTLDAAAGFQAHIDRLLSDRDSFLELGFDEFNEFLEEEWGPPIVFLDLGEGGSKLAIFDTT